MGWTPRSDLSIFIRCMGTVGGDVSERGHSAAPQGDPGQHSGPRHYHHVASRMSKVLYSKRDIQRGTGLGRSVGLLSCI